MARDHTRVNIDIWGDDEFRDLPVDAQNLFWTLWTSPDRTYCGGHWWHAGKLAQFAGDWTVDRVEGAGAVLSERLFLIVDELVDECLLRSWIKHDGLWKTPNMAVSMANARAAMTSKVCRGVVVHEVRKLATANPGMSGWKRDEVANLLSQKAVDPSGLEPFTPTSTPGVTPALTPLLTPALTPRLRVNGGVGVNPPSNPPPTTATTTPTATTGGYVTREPHQSGDPGPEPPLHCPLHPDGTDKPCRPCGRQRDVHNDWAKAKEQHRDNLKAAFWCGVLACDECDPKGLIDTEAGMRRCPLHDWEFVDA